MPIRPFAAAGLALVMALSALCARAAPVPGFAGRWITASGNLEVEIAPCGEAWCGTVARVLANRSMSAPGRDMEAADPRPALGMKILTGLKPSEDGRLLEGEIYNRENGKTYSVRLTLQSAQQLEVRPYVFLPLFGKTQQWQRPVSPPAPDAAVARPARPASTPAGD